MERYLNAEFVGCHFTTGFKDYENRIEENLARCEVLFPRQRLAGLGKLNHQKIADRLESCAIYCIALWKDYFATECHSTDAIAPLAQTEEGAYGKRTPRAWRNQSRISAGVSSNDAWSIDISTISERNSYAAQSATTNRELHVAGVGDRHACKSSCTQDGTNRLVGCFQDGKPSMVLGRSFITDN